MCYVLGFRIHSYLVNLWRSAQPAQLGRPTHSASANPQLADGYAYVEHRVDSGESDMGWLLERQGIGHRSRADHLPAVASCFDADPLQRVQAFVDVPLLQS